MLDQKGADMLLEIGDIRCACGMCRHAMRDNDEDLEGRLDELSNDGFFQQEGFLSCWVGAIFPPLAGFSQI